MRIHTASLLLSISALHAWGRPLCTQQDHLPCVATDSQGDVETTQAWWGQGWTCTLSAAKAAVGAKARWELRSNSWRPRRPAASRTSSRSWAAAAAAALLAPCSTPTRGGREALHRLCSCRADTDQETLQQQGFHHPVPITCMSHSTAAHRCTTWQDNERVVRKVTDLRQGRHPPTAPATALQSASAAARPAGGLDHTARAAAAAPLGPPAPRHQPSGDRRCREGMHTLSAHPHVLL